MMRPNNRTNADKCRQNGPSMGKMGDPCGHGSFLAPLMRHFQPRFREQRGPLDCVIGEAFQEPIADYSAVMDLKKLGGNGSAGWLGGQILVAMPGMIDARFRRSVIFMCGHSDAGAMGIVINQRASSMTFRDLLVQLDIIEADQAIRLPRRISHASVMKGGPVETSRGFVLHSADYRIDNVTQNVGEGIAMTATLDILKAMAREEGPSVSLMALGYSGWAAGQIEREIAQNGWLHCPADEALLFDGDIDSKYDRALKKIGIDPAMLSSEAGRA
jgi:putative transcriptional regulator